MTWFDEALYLIAEADKDAPEGMSLEDRKKRVNNAKPHHFRSTSWGNKVWPKAKKAYFAAYETKKPEIIVTDFGPSPLERARMSSLNRH